MEKKIAIIGGGEKTTMIREVVQSSDDESVFVEQVIDNPAFTPEPTIVIKARPFLAEFDYPLFDPPKSKYIPNRKKK